MGRLENFIPKLEKYRLEGGGGIYIMQFEGADSIPIDEEVLAFIKQVNGHFSLKEIFQFLNQNSQNFSVDKSLSMLEHLADLGLLKNSSDLQHILAGDFETKSHPIRADELQASYFSNERLIALIQKTTLFLECTRSVAQNILDQSSLEHLQSNEVLIEKGSKSPFFYVLLAGEVAVSRDGQHLATLKPLSVFGESAAIFDKVRNADVTTSANSWLIKIDASKIVDTASPESFNEFKGLKSRLILNQTLSANPSFRKIPTDVLQLFISKCRLEMYGKEQMVIEQGETSGDFYFILQGSVSVVKDAMPVTSLTEGNHFGEVAAMFHHPRTASIITESKATFLVLNQKALFEVLSNHFRMAIDVERIAKARLNSSNNILQIFDEDHDEKVDTELIHRLDLSSSEITFNQEILESSSSNFELELVDFSSYGHDDEDEEAS